MLYVDYTTKYGYALMQANDGKTYLKVGIYKANCLFASVYRYKDNKGQRMAQLVGFYSDLKHLQRCYKPQDPIYRKDQIKKVVLYTNLKDVGKVAEIIAKGGFKVDIRPNPKKAKNSK